MSAEAIVWLIFIAIWFISGIVKQIKQVSAQRPGQADPGQKPPGRERGDLRVDQDPGRRPQRPDRPERPQLEDDPMVQLLRKLGGEFEVQPEEPPREQPVRRPPPPQSRPQSPPESRPLEAEATPPVPRAAARSSSRPKVAKMASIPEMDLPPMSKTGQAERRKAGAGALARAIRRDLRNPASTRKAIVLQEILGKPPGLEGMKS